MLIVFSGLPGTGKSELAQRIGRRLRIPVLSVDPIESAILRAGIAILTVDAVESCEANLNRILAWLEHGVRQTESQ